MGKRRRSSCINENQPPGQHQHHRGIAPTVVSSQRANASVMGADDDDDSDDSAYGYYFSGRGHNFPGHHFGRGYTTYKPKPEVDPAKKLLLEKMMVAHYIEEVPEDCNKSVVYVMQGDGVYEKRKNKLGWFTTQIAEIEIPGLKKELSVDWELNVPKIPASYLGTTVAFFRNIYKKHSSEVFLQFFYDLEKKEYIIHCPKQIVSGASVQYSNDENFEDETKILVFEIHSHGNMHAFFSSIDDSDEKADRFYGVIGSVTEFFPEMKIRLLVGGRAMDVEVEELFNLDEEMYHVENYPKDWAARIEERKVKKFKARSFPGKEGGLGFTGHGAAFPGWQDALFGGADIEEMDLVDKFESNEYLMSQDDYVPDDSNEDTDSYWMQEGNRLWRVENGKKVYFMEDGEAYYEVPDNTNDNNDDEVEDDPTNHRGKRF